MTPHITITRAEGRVEECITVTVTSYAEADRVLNEWAKTAPDTGGYDKCDFTVVGVAEEHTYTGRFDLEREHTTGTNLLQQQMLRFVAWCYAIDPDTVHVGTGRIGTLLGDFDYHGNPLD